MTTASPSEILIRSLIDYAGLFPPASKDLAEAVSDYARFLRRPDARLLARFIVPVTRLHELTPFVSLFDARFRLRLSILAPPGSAIPDMADTVGYAAAAGDSFALASDDRVVTETFETRVPDGLLDQPSRLAADLEGASAASGGRPVYVELPFIRRTEEAFSGLDVLARTRSAGSHALAAKIRCGGEHPTDYPEPGLIARFLARCVELDVPFKATAGLHHPVRAWHESEGVWMHGFVNVFVASALSFARSADVGTLESVIAETDPDAFAFSGESVGWRDVSLSRDDVTRARHEFAHGFGSCSFDEPTDDLRTLGWLTDNGHPHLD